MYKHILIPTDGSELAGLAVDQGLALARALGAHVTLVAVTYPYREMPAEAVPLQGLQEIYEREVRARAEAWLARAAEKGRAAGVPCRTLVRQASQPYEAIAKVLAEQGCDLVVMSSHGRGGLNAVILGSQTRKLLAHSPAPVLVVRQAARE